MPAKVTPSHVLVMSSGISAVRIVKRSIDSGNPWHSPIISGNVSIILPFHDALLVVFLYGFWMIEMKSLGAPIQWSLSQSSVKSNMLKAFFRSIKGNNLVLAIVYDAGRHRDMRYYCRAADHPHVDPASDSSS